MAELTIQEAAASLGVGVDVVRRCIMANQLKTCRDPQGRTLVVLPGAVGAAAAAGAQPAAPDPRLDVVVALQSEISFLRSELEVRDEEMRRRDVIIAQLTQRLPRRLAPPLPIADGRRGRRHHRSALRPPPRRLTRPGPAESRSQRLRLRPA